MMWAYRITNLDLPSAQSYIIHHHDLFPTLASPPVASPPMDPYSHAYPSSHRRSTSKIISPPSESKRRFAFLPTLQEPLLVLVASNLASAYAVLGVDRWGHRPGIDPFVLVPTSFLVGASWGWLRGKGRWDLVGKMVGILPPRINRLSCQSQSASQLQTKQVVQRLELP